MATKITRLLQKITFFKTFIIGLSKKKPSFEFVIHQQVKLII